MVVNFDVLDEDDNNMRPSNRIRAGIGYDKWAEFCVQERKEVLRKVEDLERGLTAIDTA